METLWMWAARSFTSPADLSAIELGATGAAVVWSAAMLTAVRYLTSATPETTEAREEYDEAA